MKYKIKLVMGEDTQTEAVHKGEGDSINKALDALKLDYMQINQKGTIYLEYGRKKSSRFFHVRPLRRIIVNKLRKAQVARDLDYLLA